jgi:hypothetical protein
LGEWAGEDIGADQGEGTAPDQDELGDDTPEAEETLADQGEDTAAGSGEDTAAERAEDTLADQGEDTAAGSGEDIAAEQAEDTLADQGKEESHANHAGVEQRPERETGTLSEFRAEPDFLAGRSHESLDNGLWPLLEHQREFGADGAADSQTLDRQHDHGDHGAVTTSGKKLNNRVKISKIKKAVTGDQQGAEHRAKPR